MDLSTSVKRFAGCVLLAMSVVSSAGSYADTGAEESKSAESSLGPAPGTYELARDRESVELPFEFYDMNLMVRARMNDVDIKMLIDNGVMWDQLLFYGSDQVDSLGMDYEGGVHVTGAGEGEGMDSYTASGVSLSFGDLTFHDQDAVITPKEQGLADYFPGIAGQVCGAFFKHFVVEFDFDRKLLILHKPDTYHYTGDGRALEMTRDPSGAYSVPVSITPPGHTEVQTDLFIDLGGVYPVSLVVDEARGFARPASEKILLGYGASGPINGYKGTLPSLKIAGYELGDVEAVFTDSGAESDHTNTTIGLPLLKRFHLVFDYFHRKLYVQPNQGHAG